MIDDVGLMMIDDVGLSPTSTWVGLLMIDEAVS